MSSAIRTRPLLDTLRLVGHFVSLSLRSQMQYRASFVLQTIGIFCVTGIEFLGVWALFARFGSLRGWSLGEVALLYGMVNVAFALAELVGRGFDTFPGMVQRGEFDRVLLRPRSTALLVAAREVHLMRVGRMVQGVAVLGWAMAAVDVVWTPARVTLLVCAVAGGVCLFVGLFVILATMSFWTIESLEVMNTVTYGGVETAQYPLAIYRGWFRRFFTYVVPLACVNYFPALAILGKGGGGAGWVAWLSPMIGLAFLCATLGLWTVGVRHYHSTGS